MSLKENLVKKDIWKLERACEGGRWLTVLTSYQDGTDPSREEFRNSLRYPLDITPHNTPPWHTMAAATRLWCSTCFI